MSSTYGSSSSKKSSPLEVTLVIVILVLMIATAVSISFSFSSDAEATNVAAMVVEDRVVETLYQDGMLVIEGEDLLITVDSAYRGQDKSALALFRYLEEGMTVSLSQTIYERDCSSDPGEPVVFCTVRPDDLMVLGHLKG